MIETIDAQAPELGRIRIGTKETGTKNGKTYERPVKLDVFRFTGHDDVSLKAIASQHGGEVVPWEGAPEEGQFDLITTSNSVPVLLPQDALTAWFEAWRGGVCIRRCTGKKATVAVKEGTETGFQEQDCFCAAKSLVAGDGDDVKKGACDLVSRLSVILPDVPGLGVWRLDTGSIFAYKEIAGQVAILDELRRSGVRNVPADLCVEIRKIRKAGQPTKEFPVPTLRVRKSMTQLYASAGRELGTGTAHAGAPKELVSARESTIAGKFAKHVEMVIYATSDAGLSDDESKALCLAVTEGRTASRRDLTLVDAQAVLGALMTDTWRDLVAKDTTAEQTKPAEQGQIIDTTAGPATTDVAHAERVAKVQAAARSLPPQQHDECMQWLTDNNLDYPHLVNMTDANLKRVEEAVATFRAEADHMAGISDVDLVAEAKAAGITQPKLIKQARPFAKDLGMAPPGSPEEITDDTLLSRVRGWIAETKASAA